MKDILLQSCYSTLPIPPSTIIACVIYTLQALDLNILNLYFFLHSFIFGELVKNSLTQKPGSWLRRPRRRYETSHWEFRLCHSLPRASSYFCLLAVRRSHTTVINYRLAPARVHPSMAPPWQTCLLIPRRVWLVFTIVSGMNSRRQHFKNAFRPPSVEVRFKQMLRWMRFMV